MSAVEPLLIQDTPIDWDRYSLTDDDMARVVSPLSLVERTQKVLRGFGMYEGMTLPWSKVQNQVRLRRQKLSIWAGITHHGKTQVVKQLCLHAMRAGEVICIASLEENPEDTFADMAQQVYGRSATAEDDRLGVLAGWMQNKLWLYDQQGMVSTDRILALMTYCVTEKSVTHFVIDSLMRLGIASDDFEAQRVFFNRATAHARQLNCHVHLVCHVRKQQSDDMVPNMFDVRGASAMVDQADNVFVVWRDKREDRVSSEPAALLIVEKQRGRPNWLGKIRLWFDDETGQFLGNYGDQAAWYLPTEKF